MNSTNKNADSCSVYLSDNNSSGKFAKKSYGLMVVLANTMFPRKRHGKKTVNGCSYLE